MLESPDVNSEKEEAIARYNRFRRILKLWRFFQVLVAFGLISWLSACLPAVLDSSWVGFNHHLVFLLGNAIVVALFVNFRKNDGLNTFVGHDFYDEYVKYSEVARLIEPSLAPSPDEEADSGNEQNKEGTDDLAAAIEKATRQIKRFQRIQSEKLKQEIARPELRRSETQNRRKTSGSQSSSAAAEMEALTKEEFQRRIDEFIQKHKRLEQQQILITSTNNARNSIY